MNWNAVIKSLQEEARACARRSSTNSTQTDEWKRNEILKMEIYIDLSKALAEGLNNRNPVLTNQQAKDLAKEFQDK